VRIISGRFQKNEKDNWKHPIESSEGIIVTAIESYFMLPWSRHYARIDEGQYAIRVLALIRTAIKAGHIPSSYNLVYHYPPNIWLSNKFVSRTVIEAYFCLISDYLREKQMKPDGVRKAGYGEENIRSNEYSGK